MQAKNVRYSIFKDLNFVFDAAKLYLDDNLQFLSSFFLTREKTFEYKSFYKSYSYI